MKTRLFVLLTIVFFASLSLFAEEKETAKPTYGVKVERIVSVAYIEDKVYENVTVELDAASIDTFINEGVKITAKDSNGKKIYKKRFSKSFLYGFSDNTLQVGKGNVLTQVIIFKSSSGEWIMKLKEKGLY